MRLHDNVGVFVSLDPEKMSFVGFGRVIEVNATPPKDIPSFGAKWEKVQMAANDEIIWSCECTVMTEKESLTTLSLATSKIEHMSMEEVRYLRGKMIEKFAQ